MTSGTKICPGALPTVAKPPSTRRLFVRDVQERLNRKGLNAVAAELLPSDVEHTLMQLLYGQPEEDHPKPGRVDTASQ